MGKKKSRSRPFSSPRAGGEKDRTFPGSGHLPWIVAFIASAATFLLYLPALQNGFLRWDDQLYIYENPAITSIDLKFVRWIFGFHAYNWHPLTWVSHAIDYASWGLNPMGHHLGSIVLHSINTFLVCLLVFHLIRSARQAGETSFSLPGANSALFAAGATAFLFGAHPVHVESVAWVAERKDVLVGLFFLLSLLSYTRYVATGKRADYLLSLFFFPLAVMSKPMAVTLPAVLLVADVYPFRRFAPGKGIRAQKDVIIEKLPFFFVSVASSVLTLLAQSTSGAVRSFEQFPLGHRVLVATKGFLFYIVKMLFPVSLSPYYPYPKDISLFSLSFLLPILFFIAVTVSCVWAWKRGQRLFLAVWAFYVVTLLPVIGIIQVGEQAAADRYLYLPSLGPFLLISLGAAALWEKTRRRSLFLVALVVILSAMGWLTTAQIRVWKDSATLWTRVLEEYPGHERAYANRADYYGEQKEYRAQIKDLSKAIELNPVEADYFNNRAVAYLMLKDYDNGLKDLSRTIELYNGKGLKPALFSAYHNRCKANIELGRYDDALADCSKAVELEPKNAMAYFGRGVSFRSVGEHQKAIRDFDKAVELNPEYAEAYNERGAVLGMINRLDDSLTDFSKAIELYPQYSSAYYNRGATYLRMGKEKEAFLDLQQAARLGNKNVQDILDKRGIRW